MSSTALLSTEEAAHVLGKPPRTLEQWRYLNRGPAYVKVGAGVRYRAVDIEAYITEHRVCPGGDAA